MPTTCFMLEPTNRFRHFVRRYSQANRVCTVGNQTRPWCDAIQFLDERETEDGKEPESCCTDATIASDRFARLQFPKACMLCGREFEMGDHYQEGWHALYREPSGALILLREAKPGAMWRAPWLIGEGWNRAGDPKGSLHVHLPNGLDWCIDGPASNGEGWTRSGEPPNVTAHPSIQAGNYHGFLQAGVLTDGT